MRVITAGLGSSPTRRRALPARAGSARKGHWTWLDQTGDCLGRGRSRDDHSQ